MANREQKFYYCYSPYEKAYFDLNGFPYQSKGIHYTTKKKFWTYPSGRIVDLLHGEYQKFTVEERKALLKKEENLN